MRNKLIITIIILVIGLVWWGCENVINPTQPTENTNTPISARGPLYKIDAPCEPKVLDLLAGQDIYVGTVTISNNETTLFVTYETTEPGWCLTETHLHVATDEAAIPQTKKGNPIPGHFDYTGEHDPCVTEFTYEILLSDIEGDVDCDDENDELVIAAHAVVEKVTLIREAPYTADNVVDSYQGRRNDGSAVRWQRSFPTAVLGTCEGSTSESTFFTLGYGGTWSDVTYGDGWIVIEFDPPVTGAVGPDLLVTEVSPDDYPECEKALVYGSNNGTDWVYIGEADNSTNYVGGWNNTTELEFPGGLDYARYIKLVDNSDPNPPDWKDTGKYNGPLDAYDIRCVQALNDYVEVQEETAWAGECTRFVEQGNWATYCTYDICCEEPCDEWVVYGTSLGGSGTGSKIYEIDLKTLTATELFSTGLNTGIANWPNGAAYNPQNNVLYYSVKSNKLYFYDFAGTQVDATNGHPTPGEVACGSFYDGYYYYIPQNSGTLYKVTLDQTPSLTTNYIMSVDAVQTYSGKSFIFGDVVVSLDGSVLYGSSAVNGVGTFWSINLTSYAYTDISNLAHMQLAYGSDGLLYGHDAGSAHFYVIDPVLGTRVDVGTLTTGPAGGKFTDLASGPQCQSE